MMAQYRSHTPETISSMEEYATKFHKTKDMFPESRISKRPLEKADELRKEVVSSESPDEGAIAPILQALDQ